MMLKVLLVFAVSAVLATALAFAAPPANAAPPSEACWGQASAVFAQMGRMGEHASSFDTPRVGLRNLARQLHEADLIEDDSMAALGAFVAAAEGLEIDACR